MMDAILWPSARAHQAVEALARAGGLVHRAAPAAPTVHAGVTPRETIERRIGWSAAHLGLEAEPVESSYRDLDDVLSSAGPALWQVPGSEPRFLALLGGRGATLRVLDRDLKVRRVARAEIRRLLSGQLESAARTHIDAVLSGSGLDRPSWPLLHQALVRERLDRARIDGCWMLRHSPGAPFRRQLGHAGALRWLAAAIGLHATQQVLWIVAWWIIGASALFGRADRGWLIGWALVLATIIFLRFAQGWAQARLFYVAGGLLKRRLLAGVLQLEPGRLRRQGSGSLMGRVLESAAIEQMFLTGGVTTVLAVLEIAAAATVLAMGAAAGVHLALLAVWIGLAAVGASRYVVNRRNWTTARLSVTQQLVERLVGHRTRLAQQSPAQWHQGEDEALDGYVRRSLKLDRTAVVMSVLVRTWIIAGLIGIVPALLRMEHAVAAIAIGVGGVLMGAQALARFNAGLGSLAAALIAGGQIRELFQAAATAAPPPAQLLATPEDAALEAKGIRFQYGDHPEPVLRDCHLHVAPGDRVLIEGSSGSGKSTLAKLLNALIDPQAGLVLLGGLDPSSTSLDLWRRRIALVPAMHENHILTGPLAFNLLLGRDWPPTAADLAEAEQTCRELGLGPLVARMPAGLMQMVGETGWQLSQGEKSRVYMARALLQRADVLVMDESLGPLDPPTLRQCLRAVLTRPQAVVLMAHP